MNGYFQLINEEETTCIMLFPADGGEELDVAEVVEYLALKNVDYNLSAFYSETKKLRNEPLKIFLHEGKGMPEQEMLVVKISSDNMLASVRFYAPSSDGDIMGKNEILNDLKHRGVEFGILDNVLDAFIENREYCKEIEIARGKSGKNGQDAVIEYTFDTDNKIKPTLQQDGSVDFFHLNTIKNCKAGETLARLIPEVPSEPGTDVRGNIIQGGEIKILRLMPGKNVLLSEDEKELTAAVSGHIMFDGERVSVSDILELKNVDNSTGNIEYEGNIQISGDICENFSVKANGDIVVNGLVEGATVEAGGDIIIERGMNGMGKGTLKAGGNIIAKFFENATIEAGGYVATDSILHCTIVSKDEVNVGGKRGFISGSRVCATNGVSAKNLGTALGGDTIIEIGVDPTLKKKLADLQQLIAEDERIIKSAQPVLRSTAEKITRGAKFTPDQVKYIRELNTLCTMKNEEIKKANEEIDALIQLLDGSKRAEVTVSGDVYTGTRIVIGDVSMVVKGNMSYCKFIKDRGDVKMVAL